jgi:hypothetical protein
MFKINGVKFFLILIQLFVFIEVSYSQVEEYYFQDTEGKEGNKIASNIRVGDNLIVGGENFERNGNQGVVYKLDTLGNIVWTTNNPNHPKDYRGEVYQLLYSDNNIYAVTSSHTIWQINEQTGVINQEIDLPEATGYQSCEIIDIDSVTLGAYYNKKKLQWNDKDGQNFDLIDKRTGEIMLSQFIEGSRYNNYLDLDNLGNVYKLQGNNMSKCYMNNIDSVLWTISVNDDEDEINEIYVDENNDLYLFGKEGEGYSNWVAKVNKLNGEFLWRTSVQSYDRHNHNYNNHLDVNGYIYVTWGQVIIGNSNYNFNTIKINKNSGALKWQSITDFEGKDDSGMSIDTDDKGNVYVTGTVDDPTYGARCGLVKINGDNGNLLYKKIITIDNVNAKEAYGRGIGVSVIKNKPYVIGQLQTDVSYQNLFSKPAFIALSSENGDINILKTYDGKYQFESKTIDIQHVDKHRFVVLKQVGRFVTVEMYGEHKELLWGKSLLRMQNLVADKMVVDSSGNVIVSAFSADYPYDDLFYDINYKKMYLFKINPEGEVEREHVIVEQNIKLNEYSYLTCNKSGSYFIYDPGNRMKKINIDDGTTDLVILKNKQHATGLKLQFLDDRFVIGYKIDSPVENDYLFAFYNVETDELEPLSDIIKDSLPVVNHFEVLSNNKILFSGFKNFKKKLMLYDVSKKKFSWSTVTSVNIEKQVFYNKKDEVIYILDNKDSYFNTISLDALNGDVLWTFKQNSFTGNHIYPQDLCIDVYRKQLTITGYERDDPWTPSENIAWQNLFINTIDMDGNLVNQIVELNDSSSAGYCVSLLPDNSVWVGGKLAKNDSVKSGFIFEMDSTLIVPEAIIIDEVEGDDIVKTYPVPFIDELNIKIEVKQDNSNIEAYIYNMEGVRLYTHNQQAEIAGDYYLKFDATELTGINILIIRTNDEVYNLRILGVNKKKE